MRKRWSPWLAAVLGLVVGGAASIYGVVSGPYARRPDGRQYRGWSCYGTCTLCAGSLNPQLGRRSANAQTVLSICNRLWTGRGLLDDLVGAGEKPWRDGEAKRLSCLEVNREYEPRRLLDRQIGDGGALQDAVDLAGRAPHQRLDIGPVGHEAAFGDEIVPAVEHW